jgi:hypothetical protein
MKTGYINEIPLTKKKLSFEVLIFFRILGLNSLSNSQVILQNVEAQSEEKINFDNYFIQLLLNYINEQVLNKSVFVTHHSIFNIFFIFKNDLSTAIFMCIVAFLNEKIDRNKIEIQYLDEWFSQYVGENQLIFNKQCYIQKLPDKMYKFV